MRRGNGQAAGRTKNFTPPITKYLTNTQLCAIIKIEKGKENPKPERDNKMKMYTVKMMKASDFHKFMNGSNFIEKTKKVMIYADSCAEAADYAMIENPGWLTIEYWVEG